MGTDSDSCVCDEQESEPLAIDSQPAPQTSVAAGATVVLSVAVSKGTAPYIYAWFKDGNQLHGQFGQTLTMSAVAPGDSGSYFVRIAGMLGDTTWSDEAVVAVTPPPACTDSDSSSGGSGSVM
eukprot:COSAG06_NODE_2247_length_7259_cov_24.660506_6_plen_122_part_01